MSYVTTLITAQQDENKLEAIFTTHNFQIVARTAKGVYDVFTDTPVSKQTLSTIRAQGIDAITQSLDTRKKRLFFADMDATMVTQETLDELADFAGLKPQIAAITARAMAGELDFHDALIQRVSKLAGLPQSALQQTADNTTLTSGAKQLLETLKNNNIHTVLVSGGFTFFTAHTAQLLGFDEHHGNTLEIENGILTGRVIPPILDKNFKRDYLINTAKRLGISLDQTIAIGDGANDLPMLQTAGLGIGYRPKPLLLESLDNHLLHTDLTSVQHALGL